MPKVRDILVHVKVETAQRQRRCRRDAKRKIPKGEQCLVVSSGQPRTVYSYSREYAKQMLDHAAKKIAELYAAMNLSPPGKSG